MGMDETRGVGKRGVVADELFRFRDDVGCDGRDHVHAEHDPDAGLLRADAADERQRSAGVAHHHAGVGHHRVHGLLDIGEVVALFRVGRGQSDAGGLGVREHDLRDGVLIERLWIESGDGFRGDDALLERAVSERVPFGDVADGHMPATGVRPYPSVVMNPWSSTVTPASRIQPSEVNGSRPIATSTNSPSAMCSVEPPSLALV